MTAVQLSLCLLLALSSSSSAVGGGNEARIFDAVGDDASGSLRGGAAPKIEDSTLDFDGGPKVSAGVVSFPLTPHASHVERMRRDLKDTGAAEDLDAAVMRGREDESRFEGWPRRRHLESASGDVNDDSDGGRDRAPEVTPLFQGYGTHYVDMWVGDPKPQRQTVIVDTGSGITAFPCSGCPKSGCGDGYHTDDPFNENESETFEKVTECGECTLGRCKPTYGLDGKGGVTKTGGECKVTMSYQEGSSWEAFECQDWLYAGGLHDEAVVPGEKQLKEEEEVDGLDGADPTMASAYRFRMKFACQTLLTGLFKTQLADGILGMENGESSFWYQMYENYAASSRTFSLCFSRGSNFEAEAMMSGSGAGCLTLGGHDERLHSTPILFAENMASRGWYTVYVTAVYLRAGGGESAVAPDGSKPEDIHKLGIDANKINHGGIIVDSGTTDTYLPSSLHGPFKSAWKEVTGNDPPKTKAIVSLSPQELDELPTVLVQLRAAKKTLPTDPLYADGADPAHFPAAAGGIDPLNPHDVIVAIPAVHYMEPRMGSTLGDYSMRLHLTERSGGVLGANAMMGHDIVFDMDNKRVGFAESLCDYSKVRDGKEEDSR